MPASIRHVLTVLAFDDLPRAGAFHRGDFGWAVAVEAPVYVEFTMPGGLRLGLYQREAFGWNTGKVPVAVPAGALSTAELHLQADDLEAAVAQLEAAGAYCLSPAAVRDRSGELPPSPIRRGTSSRWPRRGGDESPPSAPPGLAAGVPLVEPGPCDCGGGAWRSCEGAAGIGPVRVPPPAPRPRR